MSDKARRGRAGETGRGPAVEKGLAFLQARLEAARAGGAAELPGLKALSAQAGISTVSLWKAMGIVRAQGRIEAMRGRRYRLLPSGRPEGEAAPAPVAGPKWLEAAARLRLDLLSGALEGGPGGWPAAKALRHRYGLSPATLRKSLRDLVADGVLEPHGARYRLSYPAGRGGARRRLLLVSERDPGGPAPAAGRAAELLRGMEMEAARHGLALHPLAYAREGGELRFTGPGGERRGAPRAGEMFGAILWSWNDPATASQVAKSLRRGGRPVAALCEEAAWPEAAPAFPLRLFRLGNTSAPGQRMADHLLALGHRRVVYLSPFHATAWSRNRLEGLARGFAAAGPGGGVIPVTEGDFSSLRHLEEWRYEDRLLAQARALAARAAKLFPRLPPGNAADTLEREVRRLGGLDLFRARLEPLCERALARSRRGGATAWVAANDAVALAARDFLRARGLDAPADLSLAGFDDGLEALAAGLTSFNFNLGGVAAALVRHVAFRGLGQPKAGPGVTVEIPGLVMPRASTGPRSGARGL